MAGCTTVDAECIIVAGTVSCVAICWSAGFEQLSNVGVEVCF